MSALQHVIQRFQQALKNLGASCTPGEVEKLGILVDEAMSGPARSFHTTQHIFDILKDNDPIRTLAVLFHDVVYLQIDQGTNPKIDRLISSYVKVEGQEVHISKPKKGDFPFEACLDIFGFKEGIHQAPVTGLNEFLSCLVALESLEHFLGKSDLIQIAACIEATIPFRPSKKGGWTEELMNRMKKANRKWDLQLKDTEIEKAVSSAVMVSNWDVNNFAETEVSRFLDNTWKLISEGNGSLQKQKIYTVHDYCQALDRMETFFQRIKPELIHHQFKGAPSKAEFALLLSRTRRNLDLGRHYLGVKLLTVLIIEALALVTGGDVPVSLFMGDSGSSEEESDNFRKWLPFKKKTPEDVNYDILFLLESGRSSQSEFDSKAATLSAYLYRALGEKGVSDLLLVAKKMARGSATPEKFLKMIPPTLLKPIAKACSEIAPTRREELLKVV